MKTFLTTTIIMFMALISVGQITPINHDTTCVNGDLIPYNMADKYVEVNSVNDLPTAVSNIIHLEANHTYIINEMIDLGNSVLVFDGNCEIKGLTPFTNNN